METHRVDTVDLRQAYQTYGHPEGWPVFLLHGFPYNASACEDAAQILAREGAHVIVPYLRGFGPTAFRSPLTMRSGQQAALATDLLALMDALEISKAILGGYDWGGRAACIVSALWPDRVDGLVTVNGYNIQDIAGARAPSPPDVEYRHWYQFYLHGDRGRRGLIEHTHDFCELLWRLWSPTWQFSGQTFERAAASFANPDFVDVVVHSYRHRFGLINGDARFDQIEIRLAARPSISVPCVVLDGAADGVSPPRTPLKELFPNMLSYQVLPGVGHNVPQEAPEAFAKAILAVRAGVEA